ncbi:MAG TPA: hypothetical protein VNZ53_42990 [Steroidobacteraceae bacterium]|jgi:hypothetical protein|nr:hypothetical protein [Steroidobacteraceae bacterium]
MNASSKRMGCIVLVCAALGFPLSSHAATAPPDATCESRLSYVVADSVECIRPDTPWDFMLVLEQIADRNAARDGDAAAGTREPGYAVAVNAFSAPLSVDQQRRTTSKFREDRDQAFENKRARPGPELRLGGPLTAAEEDFANRAYPGTDIPLTATRDAQAAFDQARARGSDDRQPNAWTLIGPSGVNFPDVLTFSGADYIDSGRITALAVAPNCGEERCSLYVGAAGGGIWRTDEPLRTRGPREWDYLSDGFGTNAIGTLTIDPTDPSGNTLYAGTGEPNSSADSEAGVGIYKTTDGGNTWTKLADMVTAITTAGNGTYTGDAFAGRAIAGIVIDPTNANVIYVASTRGVRGVSSVTSGGATTNPPTPRPPFGLWKSTDGGATFSFIWNGNASIRGVIDIALDPGNPSIVYASALDQGTWRSMDGGATFTQIKARLSAKDPDRPSFAVTMLLNGKTRMYLGEGVAGSPAARFFRTDDATAPVPVFTDLTTTQNIDYCTGQCWYDNVVYSPPGQPDTIYLGGSFDYNNYGFTNNGRAFIYSTDAGNTFTDVTWDATTTPKVPGSCCQPNATAPNGMHPDSHAIAAIPGTNAAFFGGDGGLVRSSGRFADASSQCVGRGLTGATLTLCQQLLSRIPTHLYSLNDGLSTLQFQSLSVNPFDSRSLMGGTQDNGTMATDGSDLVWPQIIYGDGGQSGFNAANPELRFNSFTGQFNDVNFQSGNPTKWVIATGPIAASPEGSYFYAPVIPDPNPARAGTIFEGSNSVWRTQDWAGDQAYLEANCPEFTTSGANPACGDFVPIGPVNATDLTDSGIYGPAVYGPDRQGANVAAIARTPSDTGTLWVATGKGRVFISKNADAGASAVIFKRLDSLPSATSAPSRFITAIYVDPRNSNHAWISYSGYVFNTPAQPGHVFEVTYDGSGDAKWTQIDGGTGGLADLPVTGLVRDDFTGDIYASTDFGVMRLRKGSTRWRVAGTGLPMVEVNGLSISQWGRKLFAATHGRSAWVLQLPNSDEQ